MMMGKFRNLQSLLFSYFFSMFVLTQICLNIQIDAFVLVVRLLMFCVR